MVISINGKQISLEKVRAWESKRKDIVIKKKVLAQHQLHLACKFMNWFGEIMWRNGYEG